MLMRINHDPVRTHRSAALGIPKPQQNRGHQQILVAAEILNHRVQGVSSP